MKWKKLWIAGIALLGSFSVVYAGLQDRNVKATIAPEYYPIGTSFTMGGINWTIIKDNQDGTGYIQAFKNNGSLVLVQDTNGALKNQIQQLTANYQNGSDDRMGSVVKNANPSSIQSIHPISVEDYIGLTNNGTDSSYLLDYTWINYEHMDNHFVFYHSSKMSTGWASFVYNGSAVPHLYYDTVNAGNYILPTYKINLPQSNTIQGITLSTKEISMPYHDAKNANDEALIDFQTTKGEGGFSFTLYDYDSENNKVLHPTVAFSQNGNGNTGQGTIAISNQKLQVGHYYLQLKAVDESTNPSLYYHSADMSIDPKRTVLSDVIHIEITKSIQDPIKVYGSALDQGNATNENTSFSVDKMESSITLYPDGGSTDISNDEFTYEIVSDPNGILSNTPAKGDIGKFQLTHQAGTASVKITKPGGHNYEDIATTIQITATSINDTPVITAHDASGPYISGKKSNQDITITFDKGINGSSVTKALKLKETSGNDTLNADWYQTLGTESTIEPGDTKTLTASHTRNYVCYWLYYDGYLEEGVEFRVDLLKDTPKIKNPDKTGIWFSDQDVLKVGTSFDISSANRTLDQMKTKLYEQADTTKTYSFTNLQEGSYTLHLVDEYGNENDLDFKVVTNLYFVTSGTNTKITEDVVEYVKDGIYHVEAKGTNNTIQYRVIAGNGVLEPTMTPDEFRLISIGTTEIEAYTQDKSGTLLSSTKLKLEVTKGRQELSFQDHTPTKRIKLGSSDYVEKVNASVTFDGSAGVGDLVYASSDADVIMIDPITGEVSVIGIGTAIITVTLNDTGANHNDNYETKMITKTIEVYEGMRADWNPISPVLQAEKSAKANAIAGTIQVDNPSSAYTFALSSDSDPKNADASIFTVDTNGNLKLKNDIKGTDLNSHVGKNKYLVQVIVTDSDGAVTVDCEVTVVDAENNFYFTDGTNKITDITKQYDPKDLSFTLSTHTSNGGTVTYQLEPSATTGVIRVSGNTITIQAVGTTSVQATVTAGNGYKSKTITIPITITPGTQTIEFVDQNTSYVAYVAGTSTREQAVLKEADGSVSTRNITYTSTTPSICTIDASTGTITPLQEGTCTIEASNQETNYTSVTTTKDVIFFTGATGSFSQTKTPQAENDAKAGSLIGTVSIIGGAPGTSFTYGLSTVSGGKNENVNMFDIDTSLGILSLKQEIHASDLAKTIYDSTKKSYILKVQVNVTDGTTGAITTVDCAVEIKGAAMPNLSFADTSGNATNKITRAYAKNDTFLLKLSGNSGTGTPIYTLKAGSPTDVIDPTILGSIVSVLHANEETVADRVIVEASVPAKNGYEASSVTCEIEITKAEQKNFAFTNPTITMLPEGTITPSFKGQETSGPITMTSDDPTIADSSGTDIISGNTEGKVTITAVNKGDRDYKDGIAKATVEVTDKPAYTFVISVPNKTYGDTGAEVTITASNHTTGATLSQEWTSSDPNVAVIDDDGKITITGAGKTTITCVQTSDKDATVKAEVTFTVKPKAITVTIGNAAKKVGEAMPSFSATVDTTSLVGIDAIGQPQIECLDEADLPVSKTTGEGTYDITGSYDATAYPNYDINVTPGTLTVTQDHSETDWYHLEGDTSKEILQPDIWHNEDVDVMLDPAKSGTYDTISVDQSNWNASYILVNQEGETNTDVFFQNSTTKALSTKQSTTIKIDKTKPEITKMDGTEAKQDIVSALLNKLTFGKYFKPKQEITIEATDITPTGVTQISGITEVQYEIYELDKATGLPVSTTPYTTGTSTLDTSGKATFTIKDIGFYRVCATTTDQAGNVANKKCADLNVKHIDVDMDDDGKPDLNDTNEDGCPDVNIKWKDAEGTLHILNGDRDNDGIPDLNIDSDGDGEADLNIDTDGDGLPDINLVILTKESSNGVPSVWKPTTCVVATSEHPIEYCTGTNAKPQINIDTDGDLLPDLNIDTNGDMKADFNISLDGESPALNIGKVPNRWLPEKNFNVSEFAYDTMNDLEPLTNMGIIEDRYPSINIDQNKDGIPDLNIDVDADGIPDINIDGDGDGVADINLDTDGNGTADERIVSIETWEPTILVEADLAYKTMKIDYQEEQGKSVLENGGITIEKPNGTFLPNHALKVTDVSSNETLRIEKEILNGNNRKVEIVYKLELTDGSTSIQPDEMIQVRLPVNQKLRNPSLLVEQADGTWKAISAVIKDGYYVYETDYLGKVGVLFEKGYIASPDPEPKPSIKVPDENTGGGSEPPNTSVQWFYASANTGDFSDIKKLIILFICSLVPAMAYSYNKRKKQK